MLAMMLDKPESYRVIDLPMPEAGDGQVLVRVTRAGICASDLATIHGVSPIASYPLIPGHECAAEVVEAPDGCGYAAGDKVTVFPSVGCGACPACDDGRTNQCPTFKVQGIGLPGGCFAEFMTTHVSQLVRLPDTVYDRFGPLVEPLAVGMHVNRRGFTAKDEVVLVFGTGTIGLASALIARALGAARVLLVDRFESRRAVAERFGFSDFTTHGGEALVSWVREQVGAVDLVLDNVTIDQTVDVSTKILRPGGRSVLVGLPHGDHSLILPHTESYRKELSFIVSRNYVKDDFIKTVEFLEAEAFDPSPMVTAIFPLAKVDDALKALHTTPEQHIKVLLEP